MVVKNKVTGCLRVLGFKGYSHWMAVASTDLRRATK